MWRKEHKMRIHDITYIYQDIKSNMLQRGQANNMDWRKIKFLLGYIEQRQVGRKNKFWDNTAMKRRIGMN